MERTTRLALTPCAYCGHSLDACSADPNTPDAEPGIGDVTLCIQCGGLLIFDGAPLRPRAASQAEVEECAEYLPVQTLTRAIAQLHRLERQ